MRSPVDRLRDAIEAWRRDEARERVWRWRGSPEAASAAEVAERHARLGTRGARDLLAEAVALRLIDDAEHGALRAHLARAAADFVLAEAEGALALFVRRDLDVEGRAVQPARASAELATAADPRRRRALARALESAGEGELPRLFDLRAQADDAASEVLRGAPPHPDAGPVPGELLDQARLVLERTDEVAREAVGALLRDVAHDRDPTWADLASALRAPSLDGLFVRRDRWRRIASGIGGLGLERELSSRVRTEPAHGGMEPRVRIAVVEPPTDVRLGPSPVELGLLSELAASDGLGRGLAAALTAPALPVELRRPVDATVGRAMGTLFAQLLADPVYLRRARELGGSDAGRVARHASRALVLETRLHAAALLARAEGSTPRERMEAGVGHLRTALHVQVPAAVAAAVVATPAAHGARFRGRLAGLAAALGMRERFDEDWFRNPRADEPLRAGAARGGALSAEGWCTGDLGVEPGAALVRLIEISA